jgi:hypothetical protein
MTLQKRVINGFHTWLTDLPYISEALSSAKILYEACSQWTAVFPHI